MKLQLYNLLLKGEKCSKKSDVKGSKGLRWKYKIYISSLVFNPYQVHQRSEKGVRAIDMEVFFLNMLMSLL